MALEAEDRRFGNLEPTSSAKKSTVAVVITTFNQAHFLAEAIESVLAQTMPADEIIVIDDGSGDDPAAVVARYPQLRLKRQSNQGPSAARNAGLHSVSSDVIMFLDADDRLVPGALAAGLSCLVASPAAGLVYGGYRGISADGSRLTGDRFEPPGTDPFASLLQKNIIGMHATVLYRRDRLLAAGAFNASVLRCEDYDLFLRMAQLFPIAAHSTVVAEYRWHAGNTSSNSRQMLRWALKVHDEQEALVSKSKALRAAWRRGRVYWHKFYSDQMLDAARKSFRAAHLGGALTNMADAVAASPAGVAQRIAGLALRPLTDLFGDRVPTRGSVNFGSFGRTQPICRNFGYSRGTPVDRYYIERFLEQHANDIRGRALEIGDDTYLRRFGGARVTRRDVLHVHTGNPIATIVGDLSQAGTLPLGAFDCLVITHTLHLVYDMQSVVKEMYRGLKVGGVALVTVPGISQIDRYNWKDTWFWSLTPISARRMFSDVFGEDSVEVDWSGNVYAATAFLQGLALEDVDRSKLDVKDEAYPMTITIRALKSGPSPTEQLS